MLKTPPFTETGQPIIDIASSRAAVLVEYRRFYKPVVDAPALPGLLYEYDISDVSLCRPTTKGSVVRDRRYARAVSMRPC